MKWVCSLNSPKGWHKKRICRWAQTWQLTVSVDKCCILSIGRAQPETDFCIDGRTLSSVQSCRDLGDIISRDLKPAVHIAQMVTKAH